MKFSWLAIGLASLWKSAGSSAISNDCRRVATPSKQIIALCVVPGSPGFHLAELHIVVSEECYMRYRFEIPTSVPGETHELLGKLTIIKNALMASTQVCPTTAPAVPEIMAPFSVWRAIPGISDVAPPKVYDGNRMSSDENEGVTVACSDSSNRQIGFIWLPHPLRSLMSDSTAIFGRREENAIPEHYREDYAIQLCAGLRERGNSYFEILSRNAPFQIVPEETYAYSLCQSQDVTLGNGGTIKVTVCGHTISLQSYKCSLWFPQIIPNTKLDSHMETVSSMVGEFFETPEQLCLPETLEPVSSADKEAIVVKSFKQRTGVDGDTEVEVVCEGLDLGQVAYSNIWTRANDNVNKQRKWPMQMIHASFNLLTKKRFCAPLLETRRRISMIWE